MRALLQGMGRKPHCERINGALLPFGYSPLALQNMTGKDLAVPDRLVVAARHHEASYPHSEST